MGVGGAEGRRQEGGLEQKIAPTPVHVLVFPQAMLKYVCCMFAHTTYVLNPLGVHVTRTRQGQMQQGHAGVSNGNAHETCIHTSPHKHDTEPATHRTSSWSSTSSSSTAVRLYPLLSCPYKSWSNCREEAIDTTPGVRAQLTTCIQEVERDNRHDMLQEQDYRHTRNHLKLSRSRSRVTQVCMHSAYLCGSLPAIHRHAASSSLPLS